MDRSLVINILLFLLCISAADNTWAVVASQNNPVDAKPERLSPEQIETRKLELLMERARQAMVKNDYRSAITSYTAVTRFEGTDFFQAALEYLGLARERNRQFAHAKSEYQRYLRLFPESEGALRVQQRLNGLLSAAFEPKRKLKKSKRKSKKSGWRNYGSVMQFYRHDRELHQSVGGNDFSSTAYSSFFYTAKIKTPIYEMKNRVSLSNSYDFDEADEDNDLLKVSKFYSELYLKKLKVSTRLGRQTQSSSGAYGRFDGGVFSYHYNPRLVLRTTSGYPVDFDSYGTIQTNKRFYSANIEMESLLGFVDFNTYFVTQYFDDVLDRKAMGLELRHFDRKLTFFTTLDYDVSYSVLNNAVVNVNYKIRPKHRLGTYLTFRRSPLLTTTNALQGQLVSTLDELLNTKTKDELSELAKDRSAKYVSANVSWQHKAQKKIEINYDYTLSRLYGTVTSDGITGTEGTGYEHYYSTQLIASDLIKKHDVSILGLRYERRFSSNRTTLNMMRRDRVSRKLSFSSKFRVDYQVRSSGEILKDFRPSSKVNYRSSKKVKLEFELGVQHRIRENSFDADNETDGFFSLGYILSI